MTPKLRTEAQYQLYENISKKLEFIENKDSICLVKPTIVVVTEYNSKLNSFITISLDNNDTLELNNFGTKYVSFA